MPETQIVAALEKNKYYTHADLFYVNRHSFWTAGQDSWTLPPAQDQDMFQQLINVEPVVRGVLQRRRGYTLFNNDFFGTGVFIHSYSFRSDGLGLRRYVWTNFGAVVATDELGNTVSNPIFSTSFGARPPRMVLSRDYGYFADGIAVDNKKWNGTTTAGNLTNWGIDVGSTTATGATFGPNPPATATDLGVTGGGASQGPLPCNSGVEDSSPGAFAWSNAGNITVQDGQVASTPNNVFLVSDFLDATTFNFTVPPGATITGVQFEALVKSGGQVNGVDATVKIIKNGIISGLNRASNTWPTSGFTFISWGGPTDLWGVTLTPTDVNSFNFGVAIQMHTSTPGAGCQGLVDFVRGTVFYSTPASSTWTAPNNIKVQDTIVATTSPTSPAGSSDLQATGFGFALPGTASITGIQVDIVCATSAGSSYTINPSLTKNAAATGTRKQASISNTTLQTVTFGGPTDLWGATLLPSDVNSATFGCQFTTQVIAGTPTASVDFVQITVFTGAGPLVLGTPGSGAITLLNGRTYFYAFQNSVTGTTSGLSPATASTGPLTNNNQPLSGIPISADPQVDTTLILATADGNDQTTLYLVASLPAGTQSFTDNTPDSTLLTQSLFLNTDFFGVIHGIANNNRPPLIDFPTKHKGRIFGAVGRALFFSKNLDEVTTANGLITSKWEEAWPATNQFDISEQAETIRGLLSDGETLWIGTERNIRRLIGDSPSNFQKPEVQFNECGILNQDVWKVVFYEGQPVGTMWLTPDFRLMASDFNTYQDVGTPIQDILNSINPAAVNPTTGLPTIFASFVSQGPYDLYMLYLPTGGSFNADTICVYNLRSKKWSIWKPSDGISTSLFNIAATGQPQWLFSSQASTLYFWDTTGTVFQDRAGNGALNYPVTIQTTWLDCGDYNIRKFVNQIIPTTADQGALTIQVDGASNELDFNAPLSVIPATVVAPASIPTDVFVPLASGPSHSRAFRFTFVSPPSTVQNVLTGFAIEAGQFHRY